MNSGVAAIKQEYVVRCESTLSQERNSIESKQCDGSEPPPAKKRRRGQNKHRPRPAKISFSEMLCPSLHDLRTPDTSSVKCQFGEKCRYMHDVAKYVSDKPPDIGDRCYVFDRFGKCPYGISCRCGSCHVTSEFVNVVKEGLYDPDRCEETCNLISKQLQEKLRKRKLLFERSEQYLARLQAGNAGGVVREMGGGATEMPSSQDKVAMVGRNSGGSDVRGGGRGAAGMEGGVSVLPKVESGICTTPEMKGGANKILKMENEVSRTPEVKGRISETPEVKDEVRETPKVKGEVSDIPEVKREVSETPEVKREVSETPEGKGEVSKEVKVEVSETPEVKGEVKEEVTTPEVKGEVSGTPKAVSQVAIDGGVLCTSGAVTDEGEIKPRPCEKRKVDFSGKLYLAPLTTTGNLPFRRICKEFGADVTCGEMAMCTNLLQGQQSEWALLRRHQSEDLFGVQVCGSHADTMTKCAELINGHTTVDFVDINTGCPIDLVFKKGAGSALMGRHTRFESIVRGMVEVLDCPLTVKMRTGIYKKNWNAHKLIPKLREWGVSMVTVHGRSREQRYTKQADWEYIQSCVEAAAPMPLFGNGDILSHEDYQTFCANSGVAGCMIARGALIKPWVFTEIKEQRHWDIRSGERLDILRRYANYGLEHWGSDTQGVENTRKFLLEWLSFLYRYIPVGLLETVPQKINQRPPYYQGRDELETLMASNNCQDWIKISEMLLGPAPDSFAFVPKHRANSYA